MATHTFTNGRTGETVSTDMEAQEVLRIFHRTAGGDSWLWFWLVKHAEQNKHRMPGAVPAQPTPGTPPALACEGANAFIGDSFLLALGMGLKRPMIRLHYKDKRYKLYLSKAGNVCIKAGHLIPGTQDPTGDEEYIGCLFQGRFLPSRPEIGGRRVERKLQDTEREVLESLSADPAGFLAKCSKDMCRCAYCYRPLEDKRSKDVGYGRDCAERWGLPWGKSYDEKVPSFAQVWANGRPDDRASVRGLCLAIRQERKAYLQAAGETDRDTHWQEEHTLWMLLGDALEELGFTKKPSQPGEGITVPSA